ncbi:uncharacterized protein [Littorina saxatilis]|uniref:Uncharacterized protein n=1 Tax=Littorina saxatilis TaxID=31220 RepID=A0AAN9AX80_9CAEN
MMTSTYQVEHYPRCVLWGKQLTRPTTSFSRGCKLWSKERQFYEEVRRTNMDEFRDRPYLHRQYPELEKHYPGTWRVVGPAQLDKIVDRLTHSTTAHKARTNEIRERSAYVRFVVDTEKAKDIEYHRTRSANPRLEGNTCSLNSSQDFRQKKRRDNRKWDDPTHWAHPRLTTSALPALS